MRGMHHSDMFLVLAIQNRYRRRGRGWVLQAGGWRTKESLATEEQSLQHFADLCYLGGLQPT